MNPTDPYGPPHKMIRFLLANLIVELGQTSFDDEAQAEAVLARMEQALLVCDKHILHEDTHLRPALLARAAASVETLDVEHAEHATHVAELRGLARALTEASSAERRRELGQTLYLHFTVFAAETFAHAAYEERVVRPLVFRLFTSEELRAMHGAILASIAPEEMMFSLRAMLPASNREERAAMLAGASEVLPASVVADLRAQLGVP